MEERKVIVIPDALQCETLLRWSGIAHGDFEPADTDPGPATQHFMLHCIRDDEESA